MRSACLLFLLCLAGCAVSDRRVLDSWFDWTWSADARNSEVQSRDEYLDWVHSFYEGSLFVPGWSRRQEELCASLDPADAAIAASRLTDLGRLLASEWAKDNRVRRIDSDTLIRFAGILAEASEDGHLITAVDYLLDEVESLIGL